MNAQSRFVRELEGIYAALVSEGRASGLSAEAAHARAFERVKVEGNRALEAFRHAGLFPFVDASHPQGAPLPGSSGRPAAFVATAARTLDSMLTPVEHHG